MDASVDRTLRESAAAVMAGLVPESESSGTGPGGSVAPNETGEDGTDSEDGSVVAPAPVATAIPRASPVLDEHIPSSADTFFLQLDTSGALVANPQNVALRGLPDLAAVAAARQAGEDVRTSVVDGTPIRLLTQPIVGADHVIRGFLQSAIVLSLLRDQEADLWQTVLVVTLIGVLGATAVTLLVTHRALAPIRQAFSTERRFVAAASHELRTPIAVIRASAEILDREHLVEKDGQRFVADVIAESDRLGRQVADLLALSSLHAGALSIQPRPVELRSFLDDVAGRAATMASARDVTISVESTPNAPIVAEIDSERLEQLLMILVDNAVDHSPVDGVVRLSLDGRAGSAVTISVADAGPGIPARERAHLFEPFARLPIRRRTGDSTGLGLAIARTLADRLGASIGIGDAPGGGALFSVTFRSANTHLRAGGRLRPARR
jgi:signal transduction histidine kinase